MKYCFDIQIHNDEYTANLRVFFGYDKRANFVQNISVEASFKNIPVYTIFQWIFDRHTMKLA
jgi:hypothetical protein